MQGLKEIADEATSGIDDLLVNKLTDDQSGKISDIVEKALIKALLEGQHRAVDAARRCAAHNEKEAQRYASAIRQETDVLIANLSSLR